MKILSNYKALYFAIRAISAASKYLLIIYLSNSSDTTLLGEFGVIQATVIYFIYLYGFELYVHASRSIWVAFENNLGRLIKTQIMAYGVAYLIFLPFFLITLWYLEADPKLIAVLCVISISEHLAQEITRFLIFIDNQILSGIIIFIRSALWIGIFISLNFFSKIELSLNNIMYFWAGGNLLAILIFCSYGRDKYFQGFSSEIDFSWLQSAKAVLPHVIFATLTLRALFFVDKLFVEWWFYEKLSTYVFCFALVNFISLCSETLVTNFTLPKILRASEQKFYSDLQGIIRNFALQLLKVTTVTIMIVVVFIYFAKDLFLTRLDLNFTLIVSFAFLGFVMSCSSVPHYGLYALGKDWKIFKANMFGLAAFIFGLGFIVSVDLNVWAVPYAIIFAFVTITITKYMLLKVSITELVT